MMFASTSFGAHGVTVEVRRGSIDGVAWHTASVSNTAGRLVVMPVDIQFGWRSDVESYMPGVVDGAGRFGTGGAIAATTVAPVLVSSSGRRVR